MAWIIQALQPFVCQRDDVTSIAFGYLSHQPESLDCVLQPGYLCGSLLCESTLSCGLYLQVHNKGLGQFCLGTEINVCTIHNQHYFK